MLPTVLLIEDEQKLADLVRRFFEREGFRVLHAARGEEGLELARRERPQAVVLDLMLPGMDGLEVCEILRREQGPAGVPIIMCTARVEEADRLRGLRLGADDYLVKPFSPRELVARVRAVMRRAARWQAQALVVGGIELRPDRLSCVVNGQLKELTPTEGRLLEALMRHAGQVLSRDQILDLVWGVDADPFDRTVDVHVRNLRTKIELNPSRPRLIRTRYGAGYFFASGDRP
jgi:DNA-binding response OmpR family regulator